MNVLLDTNVWISSLLNPHGHPAKLQSLWLKDKFNVIISPDIIDEIHNILLNPRIKMKYLIKEQEVERFIQLLISKSTIVFPTGKINLCRDTRDNHILEASLSGKAEFIITRDDDIKRDIHLIQQMHSFNIHILTVRQFLEIL